MLQRLSSCASSWFAPALPEPSICREYIGVWNSVKDGQNPGFLNGTGNYNLCYWYPHDLVFRPDASEANTCFYETIASYYKDYPNHYPNVRLNHTVNYKGIYKAEFLADFFKEKGFFKGINTVDATMLAIKAHMLCDNTPIGYVFNDLIRNTYKIQFADVFEQFCQWNSYHAADHFLWRSQEVGFENSEPVLYKKFANFLPMQGAWWGFNKSFAMGEQYFILTGKINLKEESPHDFKDLSWDIQYYTKKDIRSDFFTETSQAIILKELKFNALPVTIEGEQNGKSVFIDGKLPGRTLSGSYEQ